MKNYAELLNNIIVFVLGMVAGYELTYAQLHLRASKLLRELDTKIEQATSKKIHQEIEQFYQDRAETGKILGELCNILRDAAAEAAANNKKKQSGDKDA